MAITLIPEDGSNVPDANCYVDVLYVRDYAEQRGVVLPADDEAVAAMIISATDYLEAQATRYQGVETYPGNDDTGEAPQSLRFPRKTMIIFGYKFPENQIPVQLMKAQAELCVQMKNGIIPMPTASGPFVIEDTIGPITTKYSERIWTSTAPVMPAVVTWLAPLFIGGGLGGLFRTVRV